VIGPTIEIIWTRESKRISVDINTFIDELGIFYKKDSKYWSIMGQKYRTREHLHRHPRSPMSPMGSRQKWLHRPRLSEKVYDVPFSTYNLLSTPNPCTLAVDPRSDYDLLLRPCPS
jgi:hypothetical protein